MSTLAEYMPLLNLLLLPALHTLSQLASRLATIEAVQKEHARRLDAHDLHDLKPRHQNRE